MFRSVDAKMLRALLLCFLFLLDPAAVFSDSDKADLAGELLSLQSLSQSGIIHLNDHLITRFLSSTSTPRPYSFLIFFDAAHLHGRADLRLSQLKEEFSILALSFIVNNKENRNSRSKLFFGHVEFKESQSSFALFGVNALPHIRLVNPNVESLRDSDHMDQRDFARLAESMAEFVESRTKLSVGPIVRPPLVSTKQLLLIAAMILLWIPYAIKKIIAGDTFLHDKKFWLLGAIFVYFFSVSGTMHNIIRKMPMFLADMNDPTKVVFFYQGSGIQLGVEGFAVGLLYTIVGLLLSFLTHALVRVRNLQVQQFLMIGALSMSVWAVKKVVFLDNWKTGYGVHGFWPSNWN